MAKSFIAIKKGLGLYDLIMFGKYRNCRVDSILEQDPEYIIYSRDKFGTLYSQEVLEQVEDKLAARARDLEYKQRRFNQAHTRDGIAVLFPNYDWGQWDNPAILEAEMFPEFEDIPF